MKASEAMLLWAGEFIGRAVDLEERQGRLKFAVVAWNLACQHRKERKRGISRFLGRLKPHRTAADLRTMQHDLELLIERKLSMFPDDRRPFMSARVETNERGNEAITVVYMPTVRSNKAPSAGSPIPRRRVGEIA